MIELLTVFAVFGSLGAVMLALNRLLGPRRPDPRKTGRPFECGSPPLQDGIPPVPVPFVGAALLFLLFDIEIAFFVPWALIVRALPGAALAGMAAFVVPLAAGLAFAWKKGGLDWSDR
jgi:NADH-quinone oxidoreductase subunit A